MSARRTDPEGGLRSSALTPLLDTLFLLLFTLLATSRSASLVEAAVREEVAVELPSVEADGADGASDGESVLWTIAVDAEGTVSLLEGQEPGLSAAPVATPRELAASLEAATSRGALQVEIRADGDAAHRVVLDVLQAARKAGVSDVRFVAFEAAEGGHRTFGEGGAR